MHSILIVDGKAASHWAVRDDANLMRQLTEKPLSIPREHRRSTQTTEGNMKCPRLPGRFDLDPVFRTRVSRGLMLG